MYFSINTLYKRYMNYREATNVSEKYKQQYVNDIENLIDRLEKAAKQQRQTSGKEIMNHKGKYREELCRMLGWPLTEEKKDSVPVTAVSEHIAAEAAGDIYRMQIEVLDGLKITGLLFRHKEGKKRPFILVQHGDLGTPELISGLYGSTANYNDMLLRVYEAGADVFAPQMLLWNKENYGIEYDRFRLDARLKKVGSSIVAVEIYGLMRILDYFEAQEWTGNMGMIGLSYGGFYTQYTAALDTRIKAAISCSVFCDSMHRVRTDWSWQGIEKIMGQAEIACLVHPRKLYLAMGEQDSLFDHRISRKEYERILEICGGEADWVTYASFSGTHEFIKSDEWIYNIISDLQKEPEVI